MKPNSKIPPAVAAAKAVLASITAELDAAQETVKRLEGERSAAFKAIRKAQEYADESLPQCSIANVRYGKEQSVRCRAVILRKTPTGMLVVRRFGDADGYETKFQHEKTNGVFCETGKRPFYSDHSELRDVPAEYMP